MAQRPRVLLLIPHLGGGGAERVTALLAQNLSLDRYEVHLGLITQSSFPAEEMPARVAVHALGAGRVRFAALRLLKLVRRLKPDVILSGIFHLNFLVLLLRPFFPRETRVLVRQNGTASSDLSAGGLPVYTRFLYRHLYRRADSVVCQTRAMAEDLIRQFGLRETHLAVLPNPIDFAEIRDCSLPATVPWNGPGPHLLAVGRLSPEKGFDLLLEALAAVRTEFPHADLLLAGAGPEEVVLRAQCHALRLETAVRFAGHVAHPWSCFPGVTLFVLSSRHEGLPNALLEAAAGGLPLVALPASDGVADMLRGQPGVWLAPEVSARALATSLLAALHTLQPGERFTHTFVDGFRLDRAMQAYEGLIDQTLRAATTEKQP